MKIYIDGEKLMESFYDTPKSKRSWSRAWWLINHAKLADVRENVRGEWVTVVEKTEMYDKEGVKTWGSLCQCNKCGFVLNAVEGHIGQYNFCPHCGADMRGDTT